MMFLQKISDKIEHVLKILGYCFSIVFMTVVLFQIIVRLIFPFPVSWTEEVSRFFFLFTIAVSAPLVIKHNDLVYVDFFIAKASDRCIYWIQFITHICITILSSITVWYAVLYSINGLKQIAPATKISMAIPYSSTVILFLFIAVFSIQKIFELRQNIINKVR